MLNVSPQKLGILFEKWFSKRYEKFKRVKGSGSTPFYKLDVNSQEFEMILSLKATTKKSFSLKLDYIDEIEDSINAPGGVGGDYIGAMVVLFADTEDFCYDPHEVIVSLRLDDLVRLLDKPQENVLLSRSESKRKAAQTPAILRKEKT